jgi:hypothetical protein
MKAATIRGDKHPGDDREDRDDRDGPSFRDLEICSVTECFGEPLSLKDT